MASRAVAAAQTFAMRLPRERVFASKFRRRRGLRLQEESLHVKTRAMSKEPALIAMTNQTHPATDMRPPRVKFLRVPIRRDLTGKAKINL